MEQIPEDYQNVEAYMAKPNTWFMAGTEAELLTPIFQETAIFLGVRSDTGLLDEETCSLDEFDVVEKWEVKCRDCGLTKYEFTHNGHAKGCKYE